MLYNTLLVNEGVVQIERLKDRQKRIETMFLQPYLVSQTAFCCSSLHRSQWPQVSVHGSTSLKLCNIWLLILEE